MKKLRALAATALATGALVAGPAAVPAQAGNVVGAASCYGFYYSYSINSTHIQATATNACPGGGPAGYMVIERLVNGNWSFVNAGTGFVGYNCVGTATNTYHIGPIFTVGVPSYTWYQFTDACS